MATNMSRELGQLMVNTTTRRNLLKRAGSGALAAVAAMSLPRIVGAQPRGLEDVWVLAYGVSEMPADKLVWRLVADNAAPAGQGESLERALGFAMATV